MKQLFLLLLALCLGCSFSRPVSGPAMAEMLRERTVVLLRDGDFGPQVSCSGVWMNEQVILTAAHCVKHRQETSFATYDGVFLPSGVMREDILSHTAYLWKEDDDLDLAELVIPTTTAELIPHPATRLAPSAQLGQHVWVMGHPSGYVWSITSGDISGIRTSYDVKVIQTDAKVWFGNSGGGLFNDRGELLGIASYLTRGDYFGWFIHRDHIQTFLK